MSRSVSDLNQSYRSIFSSKQKDCIMESKDETEAYSDKEMIFKKECCWLEEAVESEFKEQSDLDLSQQNTNNMSEEVKYESEELSMLDANHQNKIDVFAKSTSNIGDKHRVITETEIKMEPLSCESRTAEIKSESERPALYDCQESGTGIAVYSKIETVMCVSEDQEADTNTEIKEEPWCMDKIYTDTVLSKATTDQSQICQIDIQVTGSSASKITGDFSLGGSEQLHTEGMDRNGSDLSTPFVSASLEKTDAIISSVVSCANAIHDSQIAKVSPVDIHNILHPRKSYKCDECKKIFPTSWRLKRHLLIHEDKKIHECETCRKCFLRKSMLQRHYEIHKVKQPHVCEICTFFSHFKDHKTSHVGKEPHKCAVCDKSFTLLSALEKHGLLQSKGEMYTCRSCFKGFNFL